MVELKNISKTFKVAVRNGGMKNAFKSLIKKEYKYVEALKDISFHIDRGETVGYIGPNGAGKSTTIKIMCGILLPDSGICTVGGKVPGDNRMEYVKNIGVVFGQRSQLWWDVPVIDSFEFLRDIYRVNDTDYRRNLSMLTEALSLSDIVYTPVRQLSLGQRMRCEIAASLLHGPEILFLDEPTIGLDAVSKVAVRQFIKELNTIKRTTVILTTHDMDDIEAITGRIMLVGRGELLYDGSIDNIKHKYINIKTLVIKGSGTEAARSCLPPEVKVTDRAPGIIDVEVDTNTTGVSEVLMRLAGAVTISDVDIIEETIDDVLVKMYRELEI